MLRDEVVDVTLRDVLVAFVLARDHAWQHRSKGTPGTSAMSLSVTSTSSSQWVPQPTEHHQHVVICYAWYLCFVGVVVA